MKSSFLELCKCPDCGGQLRVTSAISTLGSEVEEGSLFCLGCVVTYSVTNGIPRFVPRTNYADSFGYEWSRYGSLQVDSLSGNSISKTRFEATTGWTDGSHHGRVILDAGCGGGRFSEIAVGTGATVCSIDYSSAVDSAKSNLVAKQHSLHFAQADIFALPFNAIFDAVFCMGVLQHTHDPLASIRRLYEVVRPGGELVIDINEKPERVPLTTIVSPNRWFWKPLLKRLPHAVSLALIKRWVRIWLPIDTVLLRVQRGGGASGFNARVFRNLLLTISNHTLDFPFLTRDENIAWSEMNTFDGITPKYMQWQSRSTIRRLAEGLGMQQIEIFGGPGQGEGTVLVLRGRKAMTQEAI